MKQSPLPIFFFVWLACLPIVGAQVRMESLNVADGLSQGFVTHMIQDSKGFLWIGTFDGLNRYDGYTVRRFMPRPFGFRSLQSSYITWLYEDRQGLIWVGTHQGAYVFDPLTEQFLNLSAPQNQLPANQVIHVTGDAQDNIFLQIPGDQDSAGLYKLRLPADFLQQIRSASTAPQGIDVARIGIRHGFRAILNLFDCVGDTMILACDGAGQLFRYSFADNEMRPFDARTLPESATVDHNIWYGKNESWFYRWRDAEGANQQLLTSELCKAFRLKDGSTGLWISNQGRFFQKKNNLPLKMPIPSRSSLPNDALGMWEEFRFLFKIKSPNRSFLVDKSGIVWVGTGGNGVWKINLGQLAFTNLFEGESMSTLRELQDGRIWARDFAGRSLLLNPQTYALEPQPWAKLDMRGQLYDVISDRQGQYWLLQSAMMGYPHNTLWVVGKNGEKPFKFSEKLPFLDDVPERLFEDRDGNIWVASHRGHLFRCRPGEHTLQKFSYGHLSNAKANNLRATSIYQDLQGIIWVGTNQGLLRMENANTDSPAFLLFRHDPQNATTLSSDWVTSICPDLADPRFLWLGTRGGGINRFDSRTYAASFISEALGGLSNNVVYGILPDRHGNLWCSTNRGICCFDPQQNTFSSYQESDGLLNTEFNTNSFVRGRDGRLWFGGVNGLSVFAPEEIQSNHPAPEVAITGIRVCGAERLPDGEARLSLPFEENNVLFEFAVLHFGNPATNRFRHRLRGIDQQWVYDGTVHSANYAALPPGNYVLELEGATADSPWSQQTVVFRLTIRPPWYRSWAAWVAYLLATAGAVFGIIGYREKMFRLEHSAKSNQLESNRLKEFEVVKNQFFANLAHELRTPLTVILGLANRLQRADKKEEVGENARNIAEQGNTLLTLTNQILDLAKLESQQFSLSLSNGNIGQFVQHHSESLVPLAESKGLRLEVSHQNPLIWMDFDPAQMQKILNNLIANAIRHSSPGGTIRVKTALEGDAHWFYLSVRDEGEGIPAADLPHIFDRFFQGSHASGRVGASGLGLTLVRDLVRLMGGELKVESTEGKGSLFAILLPIRNQAPRLQESGAVLPVQKQSAVTPTVPFSDTLPVLLVLEDNEAVADFLRLCLQEHYQVEMASDGIEGMAKALELIPDLILTDVAMPGKDGFEVTSILKNDVRTSHIPIVMLTAKIEHRDRLEGNRRGANAYLTKPFEEQELLLVLHNLLHLQQQWRHRYAVFPAKQQILPETGHSPEDLRLEDEFIQKLYAAFEENYAEESFNLDRLCRLLGVSSSQLDRKLKILTNQPPMQMLRQFRLEKARDLLRSQPGLSIKDVCFRTGFKSPSHFSRAFSEAFGVPPSAV